MTPEQKRTYKREYMREYRKTHSQKAAHRRYYEKNREQCLRKQRAWLSSLSSERHEILKRRMAESHLLRKYNLTPEAKKQMYEEQKGLCYLCAKPLPFVLAHVDHRHGTKLVRGLAHQVCNIRLGFIETALKRDPETLRTMLRVLGVIME